MLSSLDNEKESQEEVSCNIVAGECDEAEEILRKRLKTEELLFFSLKQANKAI